MRIRSILVGSVAAALSFTAIAAGNTPGTIAGQATRSGDAVSFSGVAQLADVKASSAMPSFMITKFADAEVAKASGLDLTGASIKELADGSGLEFSWKVSSMPTTGVPEGVRYNWTFASGNQTYQLQVKRSNVGSATTAESPVDHAQAAANGGWWFQLRGACAANYLHPSNPVQGCYHLGFFNGSVDTATGTVKMVLPYGAKDGIGRTVADTFRRGTPITAAESAAMSITASGQAGVSNATTSQYLNGWGTYFPGTVVYAALGNASGPGSYSLVTTKGDGTYAGTLSGAGTHVWVKACTGNNVIDEPCTATAIPVG